MGERFRLLGHRRHDGRVAVTSVEHRDASREVDVTFAIDIPQLRILRAGCIECLGRDTSGNGSLVAVGKSLCCTDLRLFMRWRGAYATTFVQNIEQGKRGTPEKRIGRWTLMLAKD
jgi:hypothetical protein